MTVATHDDTDQTAQQTGTDEQPHNGDGKAVAKSAAPLAVPLTAPLSGLDEAWRMAQALAQSGLMPDELRNKPSNVLVTVLYGRELNLGPMQAIQVIQVIKGKPFISGQLWLSLVRRAGHRATVTGDDKSATCAIVRGDTGEEHSETFTYDHAKRAGLAPGKPDSNWAKYPDRMLRWRAVANCARLICPEVALGFGALEEWRDEDHAARPTLAQVAQHRETVTVDKATGEVVDAEEVPDDAETRAEVLALQQQATEPDAPEHADEDEPQTDLLGDADWPPVTPPGGKR